MFSLPGTGLPYETEIGLQDEADARSHIAASESFL